jgi:predicted Zn-dependent peptidase
LSAFDDYEAREIAGLPALVAERAGPPAAALIFRAGQADEPLARRGLTHLVEHLALAPAGRAAGVSGHVDLLHTLLLVQGTADEVSGRLCEIAASLSSLAVDRTGIERRVLAVEAGGGGFTGPVGVLLQLWYGARGPGVAALAEFGLRDATPEAVDAHARQWFCHGNAALVVVGAVVGLDAIELPPGAYRPTPEARALPFATLPAEVEMPGSPAALGAPAPHAPATDVLAALLERLAWKALRHDRGLAYDVSCSAKTVDAHRRLLVLGTDAADADAGAAAETLVAQVRRVADGGFAGDDLDAAKGDLERSLATAEPLAVLSAMAQARLVRRRARTPAEVLASFRAVTHEEVAAAAQELLAGMLVACPEGRAPGVFAKLDPYASEAVEGTRHRRRRAPRRLLGPEVVVGADGVSATFDDGTASTVRYDACVAAIREYDGALTLIGERGNAVDLDPGELRDGQAAVERVERALDPALIVGADERVGRVEQSATRALRPAVVGEAGELLAPMLGHDEQLLLTGEATRGIRSGILAVTDRRLLFVAKLLSEYVEEIPLGAVQAVSVRRNPLYPALVVEHAGGTTKIGFMTIPRLKEAARAVRGALEQRRR